IACRAAAGRDDAGIWEHVVEQLHVGRWRVHLKQSGGDRSFRKRTIRARQNQPHFPPRHLRHLCFELGSRRCQTVWLSSPQSAAARGGHITALPGLTDAPRTLAARSDSCLGGCLVIRCPPHSYRSGGLHRGTLRVACRGIPASSVGSYTCTTGLSLRWSVLCWHCCRRNRPWPSSRWYSRAIMRAIRLDPANSQAQNLLILLKEPAFFAPRR